MIIERKNWIKTNRNLKMGPWADKNWKKRYPERKKLGKGKWPKFFHRSKNKWSLRLRLDEIGSVLKRHEIGTDKPCVYTKAAFRPILLSGIIWGHMWKWSSLEMYRSRVWAQLINKVQVNLRLGGSYPNGTEPQLISCIKLSLKINF